MKVNDIDMDVVILGNGEYLIYLMLEIMLIMVFYVVCCDGFVDEYIWRGFMFDVIIGDGDLFLLDNKEWFRIIFY